MKAETRVITWGTLTLKQVETLRELVSRFESICPDADGRIDLADVKRIRQAKKILGVKS